MKNQEKKVAKLFKPFKEVKLFRWFAAGKSGIKPKDREDGVKAEKAYIKTANRIFTVLTAVLGIILIPIIIINLTFIFMGIFGSKTSMPNIGGYFPLTVQSGSMSGVIEVGDLIIIKTVKDTSSLVKDDIISYWDKEPGGTLVTHRIAEVTTDDDGHRAFQTKGDANPIEDNKLVSPDKVVGIYRTRFAHLGNTAMFMQSIPGIFICVVLPLLLFLGYDTFRRRQYQKQQTAEKEKLLGELQTLMDNKEEDQ